MPPTHVTAPVLTLTNADRRRHKRFSVARPGKLFRRSTQQFSPVITRNLSFSGALLEIESDRPFNTGELIELAVSFRPQAVVPSTSLIKAIVVRTHRLDVGRQAVAVRYIQPAALAAAA
jgi:hypothetical protein